MSDLKETFVALVKNYTDNNGLVNDLWNEIVKNYTHPERAYHTMNHLENLLVQLTEVKEEVEHWNILLFTLFYHDVIYNARKSDNEEKSAELAEKRMKQISVPVDRIELCKNQILATKSHVKSTDNDTNYFTDADLSVLGQEWEIYSAYRTNVRKEYSIYPDVVYIPGRRKVLHHFLAMDNIFKTDFFHHKFEDQARKNLQKELQLV